MSSERKKENWKETLFEIIFEAETPLGKAFDVVLLIAILLSVLASYPRKCRERTR